MLFASPLFREMEIYVQSRKRTRVQQEISLNLSSFFFSLIIASGSRTPAEKYMVTLLSPVVRQFLKKDSKY